MKFNLVSPERLLASLDAPSVALPGSEGDMTIMDGHAPAIVVMRPGLVKVTAEGGDRDYLVTGGFAEITASGVSVLAEQAMSREAITQGDFDAICDAARTAHEKAKAAGGDVDAAEKTLGDLAALGAALGLTSQQAVR